MYIYIHIKYSYTCIHMYMIRICAASIYPVLLTKKSFCFACHMYFCLVVHRTCDWNFPTIHILYLPVDIKHTTIFDETRHT